MSQYDATFVVTPFLPEHQPALGVSSLVAVLRDAGIRAQVRYLNIDFSNEVGLDLVARLGNGLPVEYLIGEMVFTSALWGDGAPRWSRYVDRLRLPFAERGAADFDRLMDDASRLHDLAPRIVAGWADDLLTDPPRILGFTTTFQQNVASLALGRRSGAACRANNWRSSSAAPIARAAWGVRSARVSHSSTMWCRARPSG